MSWDTVGATSGQWPDEVNSNVKEPNRMAIGGGIAASSLGGVADEFGFGSSGGGGGENHDSACYNCGEVGHAKVDCPNPPKPRPCYNCGQDGHTKAECTNDAVTREFTGTCRLCEQVGHRAVDCPSAPPQTCENCLQEGHTAFECKNPRDQKSKYANVADLPAEQAWAELETASKKGDLDDFKEALQKYTKATPDVTYVQLENAFRSQDFKVYLIATEKELAATYTNVDLQGNLDKKFTVSYRLSANPQRPKEKIAWPSSPQENLARLEDAGEVEDRKVIKCRNCEQLGHNSKSCPEEKQENADRAVVKCYNCEEVGHRVRDCPNPRPDKFACRNCHQSGHSSKECTEPRSAEGVECKKCNEIGHFSRDCPQGGGSAGFECRNCGGEGHRAKDCTEPPKCRNCDEVGHTSKECPKPRDYSRIKCSNCQEMGHTKVRCKKPLVEEETTANDGLDGDFGADSGAYGGATGDYDFNSGAVTAATAGPVSASGGNEWDSSHGAAVGGW